MGRRRVYQILLSFQHRYSLVNSDQIKTKSIHEYGQYLSQVRKTIFFCHYFLRIKSLKNVKKKSENVLVGFTSKVVPQNIQTKFIQKAIHQKYLDQSNSKT